MQVSCICMGRLIRFKSAHNCREELKGVSLRATPTRLEILKLIESVDEPVDVKTLIRYLKKKKIKTDPATVFRIVNIFKEKGLLKSIHFNESKFRYEYAFKKDHHHLICDNCGQIEDVADNFITQIERKIKRKKKFYIKSHSLEFFGVCSSCQRLL